MNAYEEFSKIYDQLMYDCDYDKWSQYLFKEITEGKSLPLVGGDYACGSGNVTYRLKKLGLDVFGVDLSTDMLCEAGKKARENAERVDFVHGDMVDFTPNKKLDFITICLDGVNYISGNKLARLFANAYRTLKEGGRLIFDISTRYKLIQYIGENFFYDDEENVTYLWTNKVGKGAKYVEYSIAFFVKNGETYHRFDENHRLYAHLEQDVLNALHVAGFEKIKVLGENFKKNIGEKDMRQHFIAEK